MTSWQTRTHSLSSLFMMILMALIKGGTTSISKIEKWCVALRTRLAFCTLNKPKQTQLVQNVVSTSIQRSLRPYDVR